MTAERPRAQPPLGMTGNQLANRLAVILVETRNPLNIGAAARAMGNFGFKDLRVVNPYQLAFREAKSAAGASGLLKRAQEYKSVAEAVAGCSLVIGTTTGRRRKADQQLRSLGEGAPLICKTLRAGTVGILFGSEKRGLSNHALSYCHWLMRIPTLTSQPSMNLGQAVAISLYELARPLKIGTRTAQIAGASSAEVDRLTTVLFEALALSGYLKSDTSALTEKKIRRLVRRLQLSAQDLPVWLGIFRQIIWKIRRDG